VMRCHTRPGEMPSRTLLNNDQLKEVRAMAAAGHPAG
jgi:hypothetical protein